MNMIVLLRTVLEMVEVPSVRIPVYKEYRFALPGQKHFEQHLSAFRPDLIHVNSPCSLGFAAAKYGQVHDIPVVATYHTNFPGYARYYKVRPLELLSWNYLRAFYNACQRVYVPSKPILDELMWHGFKHLRHLPHGVDTTGFHPSFRSRHWKEKLGIAGKSALLFVGRLVWEKDLQVLAETYRLLVQKHDNVVFVLAGDGPIRAELQQMMPRAIFLGQQGGGDLSTAYASSDLFVFPSTTETFGNVVLEAMASGLVPICPRQGGPAGIIQHGSTGLLTEPRDAGELAESVEYLLDHPGVRAEMSDRALQYAQSQTWDRIFTDLFQDYRVAVHEYSHTQTRRRQRAA